MFRTMIGRLFNRTAGSPGGSVSFFPGEDAGERRFRKQLLGISILALLLRAVAVFEMACAGNGVNNMLTPQLTSDLATYMRLGKEISEGNFPEVFYYQPFYYAVFLPVLHLISGKFYMISVIAVQTLLSCATCYLAGMCGAEVFNRRAGVLSAFFCAVSSPLILYVPFHQNETLHTYLLTLLLFLTLRAARKQRYRDWCFAGIAAGVAILNRGNINLLLPLLLLAIALECRRKSAPRAEMWKKFACLLGCVIAVQLPFIIHNSLALKTLSGPSTAANAVLALGNTVEAPAGGRDAGLAAGSMYYPEAYRRTMARTVGKYGKGVPAQMWEFFCDEPLAFLELQFRKALLFWDGREIPNNVSLEYDGFVSKVLKYLYIGRSHVLITLGLMGIFWFLPELKRKRELKLLILYGFVLLFYVAVTVFYMLSRFRAPVLPVIFVFGGGVCCEMAARFKACLPGKRRELAGRCLLTALAAFGFVFSFYDGYRFYFEAGVNRFLRPEGIKLDLGGEDIHIFDHGPAPWGGWKAVPAKAGMKLYKKFSGCGNEWGILYFCVSNIDPAVLDFTVNGMPQRIELPPMAHGKGPRKNTGVPVMLVNGEVVLEIVSCRGDVEFFCDSQRNYGRSGMDDQILPGEWVFRFGRRR